LEEIVSGDSTRYEIEFSASECDSKQGPCELTLAWVQKCFSGLNQIAYVDAWKFIEHNVSSDIDLIAQHLIGDCSHEQMAEIIYRVRQ